MQRASSESEERSSREVVSEPRQLVDTQSGETYRVAEGVGGVRVLP